MTTLAATVPITSPAMPSGLYSAIDTITSTIMFSAASLVGIQGRWSAKKVRLRSRLTPANGRLHANQNSARRHQVRGERGEGPVLVDEPRDRRRQDRHQRRGRDQQQVDLADAVADRPAHPSDVAAVGHAAQRGEQHRRHGHAEDPLGQHVDPKRVVDRARGVRGDQRAEARVEEDVEVDDPDAQRHREEQDPHLADPRIAPVERERWPELDLAQRKRDHQELHHRRQQPGDGVGVDRVLAVETGMQDHQQDHDHEVPHRGRERRDRELVVGLQDPHQQAGEAEQQNDREQHPREARRQGVGDVAPGEQRAPPAPRRRSTRGSARPARRGSARTAPRRA